MALTIMFRGSYKFSKNWANLGHFSRHFGPFPRNRIKQCLVFVSRRTDTDGSCFVIFPYSSLWYSKLKQFWTNFRDFSRFYLCFDKNIGYFLGSP